MRAGEGSLVMDALTFFVKKLELIDPLSVRASRLATKSARMPKSHASSLILGGTQ
jgi:hypothetical protein